MGKYESISPTVPKPGIYSSPTKWDEAPRLKVLNTWPDPVGILWKSLVWLLEYVEHWA